MAGAKTCNNKECPLNDKCSRQVGGISPYASHWDFTIINGNHIGCDGYIKIDINEKNIQNSQ